MSDLFGKPHYEVIGRYGFHENVIARVSEASAARELKRDYAQDYPEIIIRKREF